MLLGLLYVNKPIEWINNPERIKHLRDLWNEQKRLEIIEWFSENAYELFLRSSKYPFWYKGNEKYHSILLMSLLQLYPIRLKFLQQTLAGRNSPGFMDSLGDRTIRCRTIRHGQFVADNSSYGQFVARQFVTDNSSQWYNSVISLQEPER
jgi:hypothetical protein